MTRCALLFIMLLAFYIGIKFLFVDDMLYDINGRIIKLHVIIWLLIHIRTTSWVLQYLYIHILINLLCALNVFVLKYNILHPLRLLYDTFSVQLSGLNVICFRNYSYCQINLKYVFVSVLV
jgi:hypothetical protein